MKLYILTYDFYPFEGGQGKHIYDIYYKGILKRRKCDIKFISPCHNKIEENKTYFSFTKKIGKHLFYSILVNLNIKKIIKENDIMLNIHCGPGGIFLIRKLNIPVIATCHHTYWQQSHYIKSQWWKKIFISFEKRTYDLADKIIAVSCSTKKVLIKDYGINPNKITVIPNCVDVSKIYPIKNIKKIPKSLLFVGRLDERKGIDFLVKATLEIVKKIPDIKLFIGGKGKSEMWVKNFIKLNNLQDNVQLLGIIPDDKLNEWYNKVECIVVPSVFEGFGITVIEAMACKTPVIATNVDGISDIIKSDENGILVEYNDRKELAHQVIRLLNNPSLRKEFSIQGLKTIRENFDWDKIALKTLEVYKNM